MDRTGLELNNAAGSMYQALGIERGVQTVAGATYTLSLDLAGRLGYSADYTRIGIYVDGIKIGSDASTSGTSLLNWQTRSFQFVGKGGAQTIRIVSEGTKLDANGRGMMIDDLVLTEALPANTGWEDSAIRLSAINATLKDTDGSETLKMSIEALPLGSVLSDGIRSFTSSQGNTTADITGWNLGLLSLMPPKDYNGSFSLKVVATSTETANQAQARTEALLKVDVLPINDVIQLLDNRMSLNEDARIVLTPIVRDVDSDTLTLRVLTAPSHGSLLTTTDGRLIYTPVLNWSGEDSFTYVLNDGQADSNVATVRLVVNPVADAPTLVLTDNANTARETFRTGWESAVNLSYRDSTLIQQTEFDGWKLVSTPDSVAGGLNGFEIWSTYDRMADASGTLRTVSALSGNGQNWLELNNAAGSMYQALGIERGVQTVAGATYTLSLDLAGRLGYSADYTRIGIYVDGIKIGSDASTSGTSLLNWQTRSFQFVGKGGAQTIRIVSEATKLDANGRGMMIDDLVLTEALPANTGWEDSAIRLSAINATLKDTDGSETLKMSIEALPLGSVLSDGIRSFTSSQGNTTADITGWNLGLLSLMPPKDYNGSFSLKVVATSTETANQNRAISQSLLQVTVLAVDDAPVAKSVNLGVQRDGYIDIDFAALVSDADGDALTLSLVNPRNGTLTRNTDGTYRYTPKPGFIGSDSFSYTVTDGKRSATGTLNLNVASTLMSTAQLTVDSTWVSGPIRTLGGGSYIILNQGKAPVSPVVSVNWQASAPNLDQTQNPTWLTEYFIGTDKGEQSLAEITGLVIKQ